MGKLYFENNYGDKSLIACNITEEEVSVKIVEALKKMNPNYKIHYIRIWEGKAGTWYDVGSHSEFFLFVE